MAQEIIGAQDGLRRYNLSRVLGFVHRAGPISRSDLASHTGLNRSTVGTLVQELVARGLVEEVMPPADGQRSPGRPSPLVQPHRDGVTVLACDIGVDSIGCAVIGLGGRLYAIERVKRSRNRVSPRETLEDLSDLATLVLGRVGTERLTAVGIGVSGAVSWPEGVVDIAPNLGWHDVPLAEMARDALGLKVPVRVHNEANLGAVAEHARGAGAGLDSFIYVSSEVGLGAGIIVDGNLLQGADGYAGEVGHLPVNPTGLVCGCGVRGCWETEVGEQAMLRAAGMPIDGGVESLAVLFRRAEIGNPHMLRALHEVGEWLGLGFVTLVNVFNPRKIILGGVLARAFPFVAGIAEETIRRRCRLPAGELVRLTPSPLGDRAVLYGAAEVALEHVLSDPGAIAEFDEESAPTLPEPLSVARTSLTDPNPLPVR